MWLNHFLSQPNSAPPSTIHIPRGSSKPTPHSRNKCRRKKRIDTITTAAAAPLKGTSETNTLLLGAVRRVSTTTTKAIPLLFQTPYLPPLLLLPSTPPPPPSPTHNRLFHDAIPPENVRANKCESDRSSPLSHHFTIKLSPPARDVGPIQRISGRLLSWGHINSMADLHPSYFLLSPVVL